MKTLTLTTRTFAFCTLLDAGRAVVTISAIPLALAVSACTDEQPSDEVGARLLEAEFTEEFWIGDEPSERQFARIAGVAFASSGYLVVLDSDEYAVSVFDTAGEEVARWGGRGEGPGEFGYPVLHLAVSARSTVAVNHSNRVDVSSVVGEWIETHRMDRSVRGLAFDGAGGLVAAVQRFDPMRIINDEGVPVEAVRFANGHVLWESRPHSALSIQVTFPPHVVMSDLGGGRILVGMSDQYDMAVLDASTGRQIGRIARSVAYRGPSEHFKEDWLQSLIGPEGDNLELVEGMTFAERFPVVGHAFIGPPDRAVWVRRRGGIDDEVAYPPRDAPLRSGELPRPKRYDLFSGDTYKYLGTVEVPFGLTLTTGDAARVAGVHKGPLGVQSVRVMRVSIASSKRGF